MVEAAWLLVAVSSGPQEVSLDTQEAWCQEAAAAHGWPVIRVFRGVSSGAKGTRELLDDLLIELRNTPKPERPRWLITVRIDRLGRGTGIEGSPRSQS